MPNDKIAKRSAKQRRRSVVRQLSAPGLTDTVVPLVHAVLAPMIDRYAGEHAERIIHAYAVIALGNAAARRQFFGEHVKVQTRDRVNCLDQLAGRRWGRIEGGTDAPAQLLPIQIVNVFTEAPKDGTIVGNGH